MRTIAYDAEIFSLQRFGGISRYYCEIAARQAHHGFDPWVVAPLHVNDHLKDPRLRRCGARLPFEVPRAQRLVAALNRGLQSIAFKALRPCVIHRTYYAPSSLPPVPSVVTVLDMIHEIFPEQFGPADRTSRNKRLCAASADRVICISRNTAHDLQRLFGISGRKIVVTHLAPSPLFSSSPHDGEGSPHRRPYLLYVGHRAGYKNFRRFLQAYAASTSLRSEFDLALFGGHRLSGQEREEVRKLGLDEKRIVRWTGSDHALARAYRHARVFVYPSLYEGFGIPPLEAMMSGCVVACSDTSSLPEVVGDAAVTFAPDESDSIRSALEKAAFDETARARLRRDGFRRAGGFSWDRCASETAAVYRSVIDA